jgi:hypothetical protein
MSENLLEKENEFFEQEKMKIPQTNSKIII